MGFVVFSWVVSVLWGGGSLRAGGRDAWLVEPGASCSEGRRGGGCRRGLLRRLTSRAPGPCDRPRNLRWRRKPSSMTVLKCPRVPQPVAGSVRHADPAPSVSKMEEISPGTMQRDTQITRSSQGFMEIHRPPGL